MRRIALVGLILGVIVTPSLRAEGQDLTAVEVRNNLYAPAEVHVVAGDTVRWTVVEGTHSVTASNFDSSPGCSALLSTGCMTAGDTFEHQFNAPGLVEYHCGFHGKAMSGTVVVEARSSTTSSSTTSTSTSTTSTTLTSTTATSTSLPSDQSTLSQAAPPEIPGNPRVVPKSIIRSKNGDDIRPLVLLAVSIAAITTIVGVVLVRRGRVPIG